MAFMLQGTTPASSSHNVHGTERLHPGLSRLSGAGAAAGLASQRSKQRAGKCGMGMYEHTNAQ
jgi:hypothetical protein